VTDEVYHSSLGSQIVDAFLSWLVMLLFFSVMRARLGEQVAIAEAIRMGLWLECLDLCCLPALYLWVQDGERLAGRR
jgi:hypothetical protein